MKVMDEIETMLWHVLYPMDESGQLQYININKIHHLDADNATDLVVALEIRPGSDVRSLVIRVTIGDVCEDRIIMGSQNSNIRDLMLKRESLDNLILTIYSSARTMCHEIYERYQTKAS